MSNDLPPRPEKPHSFLPARWAELGPLIDAVLDAPRDRRAAVIEELGAGDPDRMAEIEQLVDECERDLPLMDRPAAERFAQLFADDAESQLTGVLGERYRIEGEVGRGGMARVFRARDIKHNRDVAVKIVRDDLAASLGSGRFLHEIAIAARLRHPNIVPMYDSGESDGVLYFVMPFEEGPSLRERMRLEPALQAEERISILRDVARALAYAHERGVVHRDIKPDNVLLSGGAAVVSDFGIAKAVTAAQAEMPDKVITQSGARIGTPVYMAPEQAVGDPSTDHRADIYSFGCLAYEMFAGKPPFDSASTHEVIAAHVGVRPVPILDIAPAVPHGIASLIMECLEKLPDDRPQSAHDLLRRLEGGQSVQHKASTRSALPAPAYLAIAALIVAAISGAGYLATRNTSPGSVAPTELTVAVLPLRSSGDSVEHELAYGLSDEIATALVKIPGVRVMSRRGAASSPEARDIDPGVTGRALGAQFLVTGSLRHARGRLNVLATLVQAKDGAVLWAEQFDRSLDELGTVRDDIARAVGDSLRKRSGAVASNAPFRPARVVAPEPYRLYVLAQRALNLRGQSIQASADMFRRATELDTLYAEAYAGLSLALALTPHFRPVPPRELAPEAVAAARRALSLDSTLALPHVALGIVHSHAYRWDSAGIEFQAGLRLRSSSDVEPLVQYGRYLLFQDQPAEALRQFLLARRTEPASALVRSWASYAYFLNDQMDSAVVENARAFQSDSSNLTTLTLGALVRLRAGDVAGARDYVRRMTGHPQETFYILTATGDSALARTRIDELKRQGSAPWLIERLRAYSLLGSRDTVGAIVAFERATDANDVWPSRMPIRDPMFDLVRSHPRFQRLLKRVGLR